MAIKSGRKFLGLNDKAKAALRNRLSEVKYLIIDELSMVSSDLWTDIDLRFGEISMMIPEKDFPRLSVVTVPDLQVILRFGEISMMIPEKDFPRLSVVTVPDLLEIPPIRENLYFLNFLIRIVWNIIRFAAMAFI